MTSETPTRHDQHGLYPEAGTVEDFRRNLATVQERIAAACQRVGRDPASVRLLPVSKTKPQASLRLAYAAGCRLVGENKVKGMVVNSRIWLTRLMKRIQAAENQGEGIWITII